MGRWSVLWLFVPEKALALVLIGGAILVMFGRARATSVLGIVFLLAVLPVFAPLIEAVFDMLPGWLALVILAVIGISILRGLGILILGRTVADHVAGELVADLVRLLVMATTFPFRLFWRFLWRY